MSSRTLSEIDHLLRPHLRSFTPYSSARDEFHGDAGVFLNANENPLAGTEYCRYPDSKQRVLKRVVGEYFSVLPEQIFLGSGSDEAIDLIVRAFCSPGKDSVATVVPSYGMYGVAARSHDVSVVERELEADFSLDSQKVLERLGRNVKVLFLCSPNNPTGNVLSGEAIKEILRVFPGICVVDEAYGDFCEEQSVLPLLNHYPRLVVLRTFSKAWGLAGIRLGMAFGAPRLVEILTSIKLPYNVGVPAQERALAALSDREAFERAKRSVIDERARLTEALGECALVQRVYPSEANFLLVQFDRSDEVFSRLESRGVIVRDRGREPLCGGCLRITVGTPRENQKLLRELNLFAEEARGEGVSKRGKNHE